MRSLTRIAALAIALAGALAAAPASITARAADASSPVGLWKTFDDKTGAPRAIVRIYEQDGKLFGKIESSFTPGAEHRVCAVCTDERKDQPIIGLLIIRNMKRTEDGYAGGDILDPDTGSVYRCKMHVEDGTRLIVRGYIGISLLGRTQIWQRQPDAGT
ncbi:MAG TPA: DUF2147 domain-containing protein [Steroidobacteraceae bacterium]|nr:DUF2147 domain-containing protein [Steroidobacteraceae bacterium]